MKPVLDLVENYRLQNKPSETLSCSNSENSPNKAGESESSTDVLSDTWIAHIWRRMVGLYGHKWGSQYGRAISENKQLSGLARDWQRGLTGVTAEQLKVGFAALEKAIFAESGESWPPAWPEFRKLCLSSGRDNIPTIDEVVSMLVMAKSRQGSLAVRYRHPLVLAIAQADGMDMLFLHSAKTPEARAYIRPVYEKLLGAGWADWPEHAYENTKGVGRDLPVPDKELGRKAFSGFRASLGMKQIADKLQGNDG